MQKLSETLKTGEIAKMPRELRARLSTRLEESRLHWRKTKLYRYVPYPKQAEFHALGATKRERALLGALSADCRSPVAALAVIEADEIWLRAEIYAEDGTEMVQGESRFAMNEMGKSEALAKTLLAKASPQLRATFG